MNIDLIHTAEISAIRAYCVHTSNSYIAMLQPDLTWFSSKLELGDNEHGFDPYFGNFHHKGLLCVYINSYMPAIFAFAIISPQFSVPTPPGSWWYGYCYLNKGDCDLNQSKYDSFVKQVANNNN